MSKKCLITTSVVAFFSASVAHAANETVSQRAMTYDAAPFSWAGFYFGGQIGKLSGKLSGASRDTDVPFSSDQYAGSEKWVPIDETYLPKLSNFLSGFYAGANIELSNKFVFGVDTDVLLSEGKAKKTLFFTNDSEKQDHTIFNHTFKQKWVGATRLRVGFNSGRILPYISGGIAYGKFKDILSLSTEGSRRLDEHVAKDTKTMIGYALGGGVDFAMIDNIILRLEYRYSDFGEKKFNDEVKLKYKTNEFRVGIAYKF